ncbi:undecaprenyl-diphosphate phosphatase [Mucilaginibacter myungsuensis]|uniref:Undecaprenyl-diphosphatase n=1 Tax=Mucilaginibacter myungsuensis TaxID=649104 RepID=A0A929PYZ6_9SPHI|nr:undecaprenyl-diphosphate phosphatase [Mucilaginibacter myungsuensis]MBE9663862.1 undecaprenyl-diphosphate phosphatase [Mucilaginibacter myungsuensis]MDN3598423.1 undecaprenyl-diphosphate phosphatase [Mucilaginibacter myungsuensis]
MDMFQAVILAIIEGLTEFLPVSSTGHMVLASSFMGIGEKPFVKLFEVVIQLGAILSVVILYYKRFLKSVDFYFKLVVGVIPAVIVGLLFKKHIDQLLESPLVVASSLLVGGVILLFVDDWFKKTNEVKGEPQEISYATALKVGLFQCLAVVPGVSRSAATIVGGMSQKLTRTAAAEFSFFLAVPTMFGATLKEVYDFYKHTEGTLFTNEEIKLLIVGNVVAFIVAMLAIRSFITFLEKKGFKLFGYYRIIVGAAYIIAYFAGYRLVE